MKFLTSDTHTVLLKLHVKLASGWALIRVNFDPVQEIGRKVGGGRSFVSGPFFARLRYRKRGEGILLTRPSENMSEWSGQLREIHGHS